MTTSQTLAGHFQQQITERPKDFQSPWRARGALSKLRELCGHDPTADEVTDKLCDDFRRWLLTGGLKPKTVNNYLWMIRKLAGLTAPQRRPETLTPAKAAGPLADYLANVFAKDRGLSESTANQYRKAIVALNLHYGRPMAPEELTSEVINEHRAWMMERYAATSSKNHATMLRTLARFKKRQMLRDEIARQRKAKIEEAGSRPPTTLLDYFVRMYCPQKLRGKAADTKRQYFYTLAKLESYLGHEPTPADLTDDNANGLLAWMSERDYAPRTVNNCRSYLLSLWRFLARKRIVEQWPDVEQEVEPERIPSGWTMDQLARLLSACQQAKGTICGVPACDWWLAIHYVMFEGGERIGALLQLRWENLDLSTGALLIPAEIRKGKRKPKLYRPRPETLARLVKIQQPERDLIFPWGKTRSTFYNQYERLLRSAGLPYGRDSKPHRMRRTFASHLEAAGGNATAALSHASRATTERSYIDPRICQAQNPVDLLPAIVLLDGGAS